MKLSIMMLLLCAINGVWANTQDWQVLVNKAKGQSVYFNAWGGDAKINQYLKWVSKRVKQDYGITLRHVKISETGNVVNRVLAEKAAGRNKAGSVDLVWINGENFRAMQQGGLLYGPFAQSLPNLALTDQSSAALQFDFSLPVNHMESPWGGAQLTFYYDSERITQPPMSVHALLSFLDSNQGLFTYPSPPNFYGTTFIKQALWETIENKDVLLAPLNESDFAKHTAPLWAYLDKLHPLMWRQGRSFASGVGQVQQLINDGELALGFTFNPNDPASAVQQGLLPEAVRAYTFEQGTISNTHFVAIPFNSSAPEAAMVVANFLLSPEAQARKAQINVWGDPSVLDMRKLNTKQRQWFELNPPHAAALSASARLRQLPEPHVSWVDALERHWAARYAQ